MNIAVKNALLSAALLAACGAMGSCARPASEGSEEAPTGAASSTLQGCDPMGALNCVRFACEDEAVWKGKPGEDEWWWQVDFKAERELGAILQVVGDDPLCLQNAPKNYVWQVSRDGTTWSDIEGTHISVERRMFRVHRLRQAVTARFARMAITEIYGDLPTLREAVFYAKTDAKIDFPDWVVVVSTTEDSALPGEGRGFVDLARQCTAWEHVEAQQVWLESFDEPFLTAEPRPLCAFLSGNFKEWCQRTREPWRGVQGVLRNRNLPMWASCGGAQALAILETAGVDSEWDCPRCRDLHEPKLPIYTHIGHTGDSACGDYSKCLDERGVFRVLKVANDPAFRDLPTVFEANENHCGQITWAPEGWRLIAAGGPGARTEVQCMRVEDRYIYAAQFHIENYEQTLETSKRIMANFLERAKEWGGYNPEGKSVPAPASLWAR